ncbi:unnamed protein product [Bursaphelenchus xylophilus]|uniref:(pine wood nematode) hypothetical protein n=1 Tax=Bursaphelenchus xylophilus TaxID=6326 RepID=A0A1I7RW52_BURXY|nr:unnamed protein product [Bursaphelenchus xylophilus]CAG9095137.1 unnamed protein product [Bursaphelenchus xylophilus]
MVSVGWTYVFICFLCIERYLVTFCVVKSVSEGSQRLLRYSLYVLFTVGCLSFAKFYSIHMDVHEKAFVIIFSFQLTTTIACGVGYMLLKHALLINYDRVRFASLSKQCAISRNIRLIRRLHTPYIINVTTFTCAEASLIIGTFAFEYGSVLYQISFELYLIFMASMHLFQMLWIPHLEGKLRFDRRVDGEELRTVFNQKLVVENTAENNFNMLKAMWQ